MKLYHNSDFISENSNEKEIYKSVSAYLKEINFKSFYLISTEIDDNTTRIDYGSHVDFFTISK